MSKNIKGMDILSEMEQHLHLGYFIETGITCQIDTMYYHGNH